LRLSTMLFAGLLQSAHYRIESLSRLQQIRLTLRGMQYHNDESAFPAAVTQ